MPDEKIEHADTKDKTVAEVFAELTEDQKNVVYYLVGQAMGAEEGDELEQAEELDGDAVLAHIDTQIENGFKEMTHVFEQQGTKSTGGSTLTCRSTIRPLPWQCPMTSSYTSAFSPGATS